MRVAEYLGDLDPELGANLERALDALREEFEHKVGETVRETLAAAEAAAKAKAAATEEVAPPSLSLDASDELRLAALEIDVVTSQSEILDALSRGALRFASRVAVFVNRGGELHGWSSSGFGDADAGIKDARLGADLPIASKVLEGKGSVGLSAADCAAVCDALGASYPSVGLLMPFVLGNQVVGTVYCDRVDDAPFSVSALQLLTYLAGQTLETLPVRKRDSTATLTLFGGSSLTEAVPAVEPAPEPPAEPEIEVPPEPEPEGSSEPETDDESRFAGDEMSSTAAVLDPPAAAAVADEPEPSAIEEESTPSEYEPPTPISTPPEERAQPAVDEPTSPTEPVVGLSSTEVAPPEDLEGPGWAFNAAGGPSDVTSESDHEEAQRLARLLVTEIKLYNEEAVEEGRRKANVYALLTEDIDRSRQIFEDRIDDEVRHENDYFKQALVRILAGGDPSLLGM